MSWYKYYMIYNFFFRAAEVIQLFNDWFDLLNTQFPIDKLK